MVFNREKKNSMEGSVHFAERLASFIVRWQQAVAVKINLHFNKFSKGGQRRRLYIFCACWTAILGLNIYAHQWNQQNIPAKSYPPVHIGQASERPKPLTKNQKSDSITINK